MSSFIVSFPTIVSYFLCLFLLLVLQKCLNYHYKYVILVFKDTIYGRRHSDENTGIR